VARNRTLWNIIAILIGIGVIVGVTYLASLTDIGWLVLVAIFAGAFAIGFFAYKNDGVKLAVLFGVGVIILGFVFAIIFYVQVGELLNSAEGLDAIGATIGGILLLVLAIFAVVGSIITAIVMTTGSLIGRAIGSSVWKDAEKEAQIYGQYSAQSNKTQNSCPNCGKINPLDTTFCNHCGAQLKPAK